MTSVSPVPRPLKHLSMSMRIRFVSVALILLLGVGACQEGGDAGAPSGGIPKVLDERLILTLVAEDPDIVTPIGIAADTLGRLYVLESHTHTPPKGYAGPKSDRIKVFADKGNGVLELAGIFAEGFFEGVNLAFSPEGNLYVVTSRAVFVLYDRDGDGTSDDRKTVVELTEPEKVYAHAALLGITFSPDGWMYISRGNTGSAHWRMTGSDQSFLTGYGDGGNIVRARADGSQLHEVATGFWNPVDIKFDAQGRLMVIDNDPDSRGPNRLVHVVEGGDYGYKSLYGGSGIHPYSAWNGELPGTLPFAAALGEAPSGLADASLTSFPEDYDQQMLATIWEERRIVRVNLIPEGISVKGDVEIVIEGDDEFRPVAFATTPQGALYITDWVLRTYPNHGRGRIWKLSAKQKEKSAPRRVRTKSFIASAHQDTSAQSIQNGLRSADPFERHRSIIALAAPQNRTMLESAIGSSDADVRLGAMVAMQRTGYTMSRTRMQRLLRDSDTRVRRQALTWIGREGMRSMKADLTLALADGPVSTALFETYLETIKHLQTPFLEAYRTRAKTNANAIERTLPPQFLEDIIRDRNQPAALRALAVNHLEDKKGQEKLLRALLSEEQPHALRFAAIRALAQVPARSVSPRLLEIAENKTLPGSLRTEAILSLMWQPGNHTSRISALLGDGVEDIRLEAARYIRTKSPAPEAAAIFASAGISHSDGSAISEQVAMTLDSLRGERPSSADAWRRALASGGNPERGARVFYSPGALCSACHAVQGRGGDLGPDLTGVALSKDRDQLVNSLIDPSAEVTPEYQGWYIRLHDGEIFQGRQIDIGEKTTELYVASEGFRSFPKEQIADYGMVDTSLMPGGLQTNLTISDLRDLLSFLESGASTGETKTTVSIQAR